MKVQKDEIIALIKDANTMIDMDTLTPEVDLRDIGADSLDIMNILLAVQEKFSIEIPDEDVETLRNVSSICSYIEKKFS